ncbi:MAG: glycoside hydrolase family 28 protein [Pirellulales bacterium]|nr:glycoside hydrolase family 28 protein [Pirellulales bacterium]
MRFRDIVSTALRGICLALLLSSPIPAGKSDSETASQDDSRALRKAPAEIEKIEAPFEMPQLSRPSFPDRSFDIREFGAKGDGKTKNTEAIKKAIAACSAAGGGKVLIPAGKWLTGPIHLRSNIDLHFAEGAELHFSDDPQDYLPVVFTRWAGFELFNYSPLIYARDCENIAVTGPGKMYGHGAAWWKWKNGSRTAEHIYREQVLKGVPPERRIYGTPEAGLRPQFISPVNCKNVLLEGFSIETPGPFWTVNLIYCENAIVRNLRMRTVGGPNTDGINIDSCRNVLIEYCRISAGDDCITMKSGINEDGRRVNRPTENVVIRYNLALRGHGGVVIGSEMSGGVRNIFAHDCRFEGTDAGLRIKSNAARGGTVEKIRYRNIRMENIRDEAIQIRTDYGAYMASRNGNAHPIFRDIAIENVTCNGAQAAANVRGTANRPIENLTLKNVAIEARTGMVFEWVDRLRLIDAACKPSQGAPLACKNCRDVATE